jgi:transcriptional regulator with XRE-family HTH domain
MYLPGTIYERIGDLRTSRGWSQKKLSDITRITASQISRIETGVIENISSDILFKLAKAFGVSVDYILGITTVSTPKSYDISELGLSDGAVKGLVTGTIDVQMLNRLMEHKAFPYLLHLIKTYFDNSILTANMERNAIIDMATATIGDF